MNNAVIKLLKKELLILLSVFFISFFILSSSVYFYNEKILQREESKQLLTNIKNKYRRNVERKRILEKNDKAYNKLKESGFVGNENRLSWVSNVDAASRHYQIPKVKYNIEKQKKRGKNGLSVFYHEITLYGSMMKLDLTLLHEGDLVNFMDYLDKNSAGVFDIYSCDLKRNYIEIADVIKNKNSLNINASCNIAWITIRNNGA